MAVFLDNILAGLEVGVSPFAVCDVRQNASLVLEDVRATSIHYVLSGEGTARQMSGQEIPLMPHTVIIAPAGSCMVVTCGQGVDLALPDPICRPLPGGWDWSAVGDGPPGVMLACGTVEAVHRQTAGLFDFLRAPLIESVADAPAFREPFYRLLGELETPVAGTLALAQTLMKECLIVLLRRQWERSERCVAWLAALAHPRLGEALSVMTDAPERQYALQDLADIAGMSRTAFVAAFKESFGRTPMDFLQEVRMRRGAELLSRTGLPVKVIAARVGLASRSHFSRAFKSSYGVSPADYRSVSAKDSARKFDA